MQFGAQSVALGHNHLLQLPGSFLLHRHPDVLDEGTLLMRMMPRMRLPGHIVGNLSDFVLRKDLHHCLQGLGICNVLENFF